MKQVYAEAGIGNETFLSTEFEEGESEYRVPRFTWPAKVAGVYLRLWVGKRVFIVSTNEGFKTAKKDRNRFKFVFGVSGESE